MTCNLDLTTSMGMATSQLQIPAIPPANSVDQIESWVLTKLILKYTLTGHRAAKHFSKILSSHIFLSLGSALKVSSCSRIVTCIMYEMTEIIVSA